MSQPTSLHRPAVQAQAVAAPAPAGLLPYALACALGPYLLAATALLLFQPGWGG